MLPRRGAERVPPVPYSLDDDHAVHWPFDVIPIAISFTDDPGNAQPAYGVHDGDHLINNDACTS